MKYYFSYTLCNAVSSNNKQLNTFDKLNKSYMWISGYDAVAYIERVCHSGKGSCPLCPPDTWSFTCFFLFVLILSVFNFLSPPSAAITASMALPPSAVTSAAQWLEHPPREDRRRQQSHFDRSGVEKCEGPSIQSTGHLLSGALLLTGTGSGVGGDRIRSLSSLSRAVLMERGGC